MNPVRQFLPWGQRLFEFAIVAFAPGMTNPTRQRRKGQRTHEEPDDGRERHEARQTKIGRSRRANADPAADDVTRTTGKAHGSTRCNR